MVRLKAILGCCRDDSGGDPRWLGGSVRPFWAHCAPDRSHGLNGPDLLARQQVRHPRQVVGRSHKVPGQASTLHASIPSASESPHRLHPPEYLLRLLADLLARRVTRMPGCSPVYRRARSLSYVWRRPAITHVLHTLPRVVAPVTSWRPGTETALPRIVQHDRWDGRLDRVFLSWAGHLHYVVVVSYRRVAFSAACKTLQSQRSGLLMNSVEPRSIARNAPRV